MEASSLTQGYNYLGIIDDAVDRFPWRFKITPKSLDHSLAIQLLTGRPILLNDGYLIQHPIARESLMQRDGLLWSMIDVGFVHVMARGEIEGYTLPEMPEVMSNRGVKSYQRLVNDEIPDAPSWRSLRPHLERLDKRLRDKQQLVK